MYKHQFSQMIVLDKLGNYYQHRPYYIYNPEVMYVNFQVFTHLTGSTHGPKGSSPNAVTPTSPAAHESRSK
jgi:hypothetical protein